MSSLQICPPSCLEKPIRKGIGGGLGFRRELQRFSGTPLEKTWNKKRQRELAKSNEISGERNLSSLFPSNILLVMHLPTHQKYYPHLSALPAVFADAVMENNFCHLSNYSLFIAREPPTSWLGTIEQIGPSHWLSKKADIYLSFRGLLLHQRWQKTIIYLSFAIFGRIGEKGERQHIIIIFKFCGFDAFPKWIHQGLRWSTLWKG